MAVEMVPVLKRENVHVAMDCPTGFASCVCPTCGFYHEIRAAWITGFQSPEGRFWASCNNRACAEKAIKAREGLIA